MASREGDYDAVKKDIVAIMDQEDYDDGSAGPVLVRLAWHSAGTYDAATDTGGSEGAGMRFPGEGQDPANNGLHNARNFLEPIKEKHPWISYSDLWTLAGATAIEEMGGPKIPWKPGRYDFVDDERLPPRGRLPDASQGSDHLRNIFYRMGFNDQEIVALTGAHNLGRAHRENSGYDGPWVSNPTRFSNTFYKLMKTLEWKKRDWDGEVQYHNDSLGEPLMMLPTDMILVEDPSFEKWVTTYADDKDRFYADFAKVYGKLLELGVKRTPHETRHQAQKKAQMGFKAKL